MGWFDWLGGKSERTPRREGGPRGAAALQDRLDLGRWAVPEPAEAHRPLRGRFVVDDASPSPSDDEDEGLAAARVRGLASGRWTLEEARHLRRRRRREPRRARAPRRVAREERADRGATWYVGRTVSCALSRTRSDEARLRAAGLPILHAPEDVARALDLEPPALRWLAHHDEAARVDHYVRFAVAKRSGGTRLLASPHATLARCQRWILDRVLRHLPVHEAAHGFVPGRSTLTHARLHLRARCQLQVDVRDFFPSITFPRVRGVFLALGYSPAVATLFALLTTDAPRREAHLRGERWFAATGERALPQGACTSPALANRVARRVDRRLVGLATALGWRYGRYADDLTFSTDDARGEERLARLLAHVRHVLEDEGFALHPAKTRVLRPNARQIVTGIVTNVAPRVPRPLRRRLRAILHRAGHEGLEAQNRAGHPHFHSWLEGMIAYVAMVDPERGAELRARYEALSR